MLVLVLLLVTTSAPSAAATVARTPPMGWSSWNALHCGISESIIANVSAEMISSGLRDAGVRIRVRVRVWG